MNNPQVCVLLSTYNGENFLQEQLDSLYNQTIPVDIHVRDDGSTDGTLSILQTNANKIKSISYGINIGCCHSFLTLVKEVSNDYEYYMFCDQDDVWLPNKVEAAMSKLQNVDSPRLYISALTTVDTELNVINQCINVLPKNKCLTLEKSLVKSYGYGCTMMFNLALKKLYAQLDFPWMDSHDWYMQKVAMLFGDVVCDENAHIWYRQHDNNVCGINKKVTFKQNKARMRKAKYARSKVADILLKTYNDQLDEKRKNSLTVISEAKKIKNRFKILFSHKYSAYSLKSNLAIKVYAILGIL